MVAKVKHRERATSGRAGSGRCRLHTVSTALAITRETPLATGTSHSMTTPKICPKVSPKGNQGLREWMRPERGGCTYTHKAHCSYCSTNHMAETAAEEVSLVLALTSKQSSLPDAYFRSLPACARAMLTRARCPKLIHNIPCCVT